MFGTFPWLKNIDGIGFILNPNTRKSLSKLLYADEWAESASEAFGKSDDLVKVQDSHRRDVESIRTQLGKDIVSFVEESLPLKHDENFNAFAKLDDVRR